MTIVTKANVPASLSEEELFAEFLHTEFVEKDTQGMVIFKDEVADLLNSIKAGYFVSIDIGSLTTTNPAINLQIVEYELVEALEAIQFIRKAFGDLISERLFKSEHPTRSIKAPRYSVPIASGDMGEAA